MIHQMPNTPQFDVLRVFFRIFLLFAFLRTYGAYIYFVDLTRVEVSHLKQKQSKKIYRKYSAEDVIVSSVMCVCAAFVLIFFSSRWLWLNGDDNNDEARPKSWIYVWGENERKWQSPAQLTVLKSLPPSTHRMPLAYLHPHFVLAFLFLALDDYDNNVEWV